MSEKLLPEVGAFIQASTDTGLALGDYAGGSKIRLSNGTLVPFTKWSYVFDGWM